MESQCWKAKEIWYEKCREVSKPINMMCWSCVVKISSASKLVPNSFLPRSIVCLLHELVQPKVDITQADAVPKCDTVEVEKQIEVFLEDSYCQQTISVGIFERTNAKVMEKSCQPQTEQMCNPPKKQPTQEKVHQVDQEVNQPIILIDELNKEVNFNDLPTLCSTVCVCGR